MLETCRHGLSRKKCISLEHDHEENIAQNCLHPKTRSKLTQDATSKQFYVSTFNQNKANEAERIENVPKPRSDTKWVNYLRPNLMKQLRCSIIVPDHLIFLVLSALLLISKISTVEGAYVKSSSISSISRSSVSCRQAGGFCEPMFGCLLNHGVVQGTCNGFLAVCCAQPTNFQHVSFEDDTDSSSVNDLSDDSNPASSFSSPITFPAKSKSAYSSQHQQRPPTLQAHPNSVTSSVQSARGFPHNHWINSNWIQTENSLSGSHQPDFPESLSKRTGSNVAGIYPYTKKRNYRRLLIDYGPVVNDPQCGRPISANRRVLDGQPAGFGSFPWQALIRVGKGKCGGVLVNRRHVVTAGHCVKNKLLRSVVVTLGEYHLRSRREPLPTQEFRVVKAYVHPKFQFSPAADRYDVAVLRLARPVRYAPHIAPICLPEAGRDPAAGTHAYVAGWGALIPDDVTGPLIPLLVPEVKRPSVLQVVNVPVQTNERCEKWHRDAGIKVTIWPEMVCAGYRLGGKDSCKGDSGGPLMVQQADGRWVLIGLVSAGFSCGKPGQPGIYHRISATSDWISFYINGRDRRRSLYH